MAKDEIKNAICLSVLLRGLEACRSAGAEVAREPLVARWRASLAQGADVALVEALVNDAPNVTTATERWQALIHEAERLAADGAEAIEPERYRGLAPVFDQIELEERNSAPPPRRFGWRALTATRHQHAPPIFAEAGSDLPAAEAEAHLAALEKHLATLDATLDWREVNCVISHLLHALQVYGWCIPNEASDRAVSLYDQARVALAVAGCLYAVAAETQPSVDATPACLWLTGGLYGIQEYLYDIATIGAGGVTKRLRARSFYVQLLSEAACLSLARAFGVDPANIVMAAGGRFALLLPNVPQAEARLRDWVSAAERWLLAEFHGVLGLKLTWQPLVADDFAAGRFGAVYAEAQATLDGQQQWFAAALQTGGQAEGRWQTREFLRAPFGKSQSVCQSCRRFPATHQAEQPRAPGDEICQQCAEQQELGRRLTRSEFISFFADGSGRLRCFDLTASVGARPASAAFRVVRFNDPDLAKASRWPAAFRYFTNYVPRDEAGTPWTFADIAAERKLASHGVDADEQRPHKAALLGILKADVDYLGLIMQEGLRRDDEAAALDSLTRLTSLSRQLDWFFTGWLEWRLRSDYPGCYAVYSGGDDLLLIGPRVVMLKLARELRGVFDDYVRNPAVTLSAGLAVVKSRLPIAHTVKEAERHLTRAKDAGRNRLGAFDDVIAWPDFPELATELDQLSQLARKDVERVPTSFFFQLLGAARLRQSAKQGHVLDLRYHPRLAYQVGRNLKAGSALQNWALRLLEPETEATNRLWNHLPLIVQWVLLERRINA